jgi:NAD+ diphosphatase
MTTLGVDRVAFAPGGLGAYAVAGIVAGCASAALPARRSAQTRRVGSTPAHLSRRLPTVARDAAVTARSSRATAYRAVVAEFVPLTFLPVGTPASPAKWFGVRAGKVLINDRAEFDGTHHFLGLLDGVPCYLEDVPDHVDEGIFTDLFSLFSQVGETEWFVAGRAVQIADWSRTHQFCGRCGAKTEHNDIDRAMKCGTCGLLAFPRLAPATIMLITRNAGTEALLARGVRFRGPMYSALAGFVEPGETLEECVAREVKEEVGIEITNIRYVSSQPWPFPHSLMLGFRADYAGGELVLDPSEIVDAQWYSRDNLPPIPPGISIARKLIDAWLAGAY